MLILQYKVSLLLIDLVAAFVLFIFMLVGLYCCIICVATVSRRIEDLYNPCLLGLPVELFERYICLSAVQFFYRRYS